MARFARERSFKPVGSSRAASNPAHTQCSPPRALTSVLVILALATIVSAVGCLRKAPPVEPGIAVHVSVSPDSVRLGDPITVKISVTLPSGSRASLPGNSDSLGGWRVLRAGEVKRRRSGAWERFDREISVAGYRLGCIGPDSLYITGVDARGDSLHLAYAPRSVNVVGQLKPDEADPTKLRDIRDVVSTGSPLWPLLVAGALIVGAGSVLAARWLRSRRRRPEEAPIPPGPTPEEEFEAEIARLLASGLLESGLYREFYYGVSRAVRSYLERKHGLPLLESTSGEVMDLLAPRIAGSNERGALLEWLAEGDLVKYAKMERLQVEARSYLDRSLSLVRLLSEGRRRESSEASPGDPVAEGQGKPAGDPPMAIGSAP